VSEEKGDHRAWSLPSGLTDPLVVQRVPTGVVVVVLPVWPPDRLATSHPGSSSWWIVGGLGETKRWAIATHGVFRLGSPIPLLLNRCRLVSLPSYSLSGSGSPLAVSHPSSSSW